MDSPTEEQNILEYGEDDYSTTIFTNLEYQTERKLKRRKKAIALCTILNICLLLVVIGLVVFIIISKKDQSNKSSTFMFTHSFKFLLLSDLHTDLYYQSFIDAKPTYCRNISGFQNASFIAPYGRMGCDSPKSLIDSLVSSMNHEANLVDNLEFIILNGDLSGHNLEKILPPQLAPTRTLEAIQQVTNVISNNFSSIPCYPCIGNNDLPYDYMVPIKNQTFYEKLLNIWRPGILCDKCETHGTTAKELNATFLHGGYYKVKLRDKLYGLFLNTNYWSINIKPKSPYVQTVAVDQMNWLIENLENAHLQGYQVVIVGHISPSLSFHGATVLWEETYVVNYTQNVISKYKEQVSAQLFGHQHKDFLVSQRGGEIPETQEGDLGSIFLSPAVSPVYRNNPAYRMFTATQDGAIVDYIQYHMDLILSTQYNKPFWLKEYQFRVAFKGILTEKETISPFVINRLIEQLIEPNSTDTIWRAYNNQRQTDYELDHYNRFSVYCASSHITLNAYQNCLKNYKVTGG